MSMKVKFFIFLFVVSSVLFTSCEVCPEPRIVGYSMVELDEEGRFVCRFNNDVVYPVDSVLTTKDGEKCYEKPVWGDEITAFVFGKESGNLLFYKGKASSEEIKKVNFQDDNSFEMILVVFIFLVIMSIVAWINGSSDDEDEKEDGQIRT